LRLYLRSARPFSTRRTYAPTTGIRYALTTVEQSRSYSRNSGSRSPEAVTAAPGHRPRVERDRVDERPHDPACNVDAVERAEDGHALADEVIAGLLGPDRRQMRWRRVRPRQREELGDEIGFSRCHQSIVLRPRAKAHNVRHISERKLTYDHDPHSKGNQSTDLDRFCIL